MKAVTQKKDASTRLLTDGPAREPTRDEIALCAYSLWEQQGRPQHQEVAIWLQAETQLRQNRKQPGGQA